MMTIILCIACFVIGMLTGQGKLNWVRGAAGKTRDAVFGAAPARTLTEVSLPAANKTIEAARGQNGGQNDFVRAARNILAFFGGLLAWMAKNPMLAIGLVVLAAFLLLGPPSCSPFGLGKSRGELRLEREIAEMSATVRAHEAHLGELSRDLAVNTERDRTRRTQVITQAQQEIEDATVQVDAEAQYRAYVRGYLCLLNAEACGDSSDPAPAGTDPVRSPNADAA